MYRHVIRYYKPNFKWKYVASVLNRNKESYMSSNLLKSEHNKIVLRLVSGLTNQSMSNTVIINIAQGALRGKEETSKTGFKYYSFKGIPYARPPIGSLRFKAPQPPEAWSGVRDAFDEGQACPQVDEIVRLYKGDEDCLFLNVYTPQHPINESSLKPVMVWFHGGGYTRGSSSSELYGQDFLVAEDVVIVTLNYRVGPFGFLCLDIEDVPGNAGLKDQVMALQWVQQNIAQFGGDPGKVTIFGESAGGSCVHYHLLSSMSKGLFHQAISQSGSALNCWAFSTVARERSFRLGKALGCETNDANELFKFLQNVPPQDIVKATPESITVQEKKQLVLFPFVPCMEKVKGSSDTFLEAPPRDLIQAGKFQRVPYIIGTNSQEGLVALYGLKKEKIANTDKDPQTFIPVDLPVQVDSDLAKNIAKRTKELYFGKQPISEKTLIHYARIISDTWFTYGVFKTIQMQSALSTAPIYYYKFSFDGKLGMFKRFLNMPDYEGVCHGDDIGYLFHISLANFDVDPETPEFKTRSRFVKLWTNFAKTGNPTPEKTDLLDVIWKPVEKDRRYCLNIDKQLTMHEYHENKYTKFWDSVYNGTLTHKGKL